jgi:hypothetical protein
MSALCCTYKRLSALCLIFRVYVYQLFAVCRVLSINPIGSISALLYAAPQRFTSALCCGVYQLSNAPAQIGCTGSLLHKEDVTALCYTDRV